MKAGNYMIIYIDIECKCHVNNPDGIYTEIEAPEQFNGKCPAYIEGFRVRPEGYTFTREDGMVFGPEGESVSPWVDLAILEKAQLEYELEQLKAELADADAALEVLGVTVVA